MYLNNKNKSIYSNIWNLISEKYIDLAIGNLKEVENFIIESKLEVTKKIKDSKVEDKMNPPTLAGAFYFFIFQKKSPNAARIY